MLTIQQFNFLRDNIEQPITELDKRQGTKFAFNEDEYKERQIQIIKKQMNQIEKRGIPPVELILWLQDRCLAKTIAPKIYKFTIIP